MLCAPYAGPVLTLLQANVVASEIRDPGRALPTAIKAAMVVVLSSYELVNIAYYILLPWSTMSSSDAVAVAAATALLGRPAGIIMTILVAVSCAGSITSNVFAGGRLIVAASQRHYLPGFLSRRGIPKSCRKGCAVSDPAASGNNAPLSQTVSDAGADTNIDPTYDAPMYAIPPTASTQKSPTTLPNGRSRKACLDVVVTCCICLSEF